MLCRDVNVLNRAGRLWNRQTVFPHTLDVKLDSLSNLGFGLLCRSPGGNASGKIGNIGRIVVLGFFNDDSVADLNLTLLGQLALGFHTAKLATLFGIKTRTD